MLHGARTLILSIVCSASTGMEVAMVIHPDNTLCGNENLEFNLKLSCQGVS